MRQLPKVLKPGTDAKTPGREAGGKRIIELWLRLLAGHALLTFPHAHRP